MFIFLFSFYFQNTLELLRTSEPAKLVSFQKMFSVMTPPVLDYIYRFLSQQHRNSTNFITFIQSFPHPFILLKRSPYYLRGQTCLVVPVLIIPPPSPFNLSLVVPVDFHILKNFFFLVEISVFKNMVTFLFPNIMKALPKFIIKLST